MKPGCGNGRAPLTTALSAFHVYRETDTYSSEALYFDAPFLSSRTPGVISDDPALDAAIRAWMAGSTVCLSFKSPMGTGKTTLLETVLQHPDLPHVTILVVTYRQTLALEQENKLQSMGFQNYMKVQDMPLYKVAKLICQIESLHRLRGVMGMPEYDVVVVDEVELVLEHFNSPTVKQPHSTMDQLIKLLQKAKRVVTMDAFWGNGAHEFLQDIQVSNQLVINRFRGQQRMFRVTGKRKQWLRKLIADLSQGKNVVVVCMSTNQIFKVSAPAPAFCVCVRDAPYL